MDTGTETDAPPITLANDTVGALLAELARLHGSSAAIHDDNGCASFAEIDARSMRVAQGLLACGVAKGARVGILLRNSRDYPVALFGVLRVGGVAVLLSTLAGAPELAYMVRTADLDTLLMVDDVLGHDYVARLEDALPSLRHAVPGQRLVLGEAPFLRTIWVWGDRQPYWSRGGEDDLGTLADASDLGTGLVSAAQREVVPSDPAVIIFTSGSTADPKAVVHSQGNFVRQSLALAALSGFEPGDRALSAFPFFWVGGLCTSLMAALCSGASVICTARESNDAIVAALRWKPTHLLLRPHLTAALRERPELAELLASVRPLSVRGDVSQGNSLGMTETLGQHSAHGPHRPSRSRQDSFGRPVGGIERRVVDPDTGTPLPAGELGKLSLRGGALMIGMHRKERHEVFDRDGFYRTDDLCTMSEDDHLFFKGRANDMLKIKGANVAPAEVERVIRGQAEVTNVCVLGLSDDRGDDTLVAAVISRTGSAIADELRSRLRSELASYKVPSRLFFLSEEDLPMTASAKIYKPELKRMLAQRASG